MQSDIHEIYKLTSERTGVSEQLYKDLGSFVFSDLYKKIGSPESLIVKLKGIGSWYLRKQRMAIITSENMDRSEIRPKDPYQSDLGYQEYLEKCKLHALFLDRLKDYEEYLSIKRDIKTKRHETQVLLQPVDRSDERFKSS